jgi:hypothetical protein
MPRTPPVDLPRGAGVNRSPISQAGGRGFDPVSRSFVSITSEVEAVKSVARVYGPHEIDLTEAQRWELTADLDYYERIMRRQTQS